MLLKSVPGQLPSQTYIYQCFVLRILNILFILPLFLFCWFIRFCFHHTVALSVLTISRGDPLNGVMGDRMSVQYSADTDELFMRKRGNGAGG